jgi:hypothetical protein
MDEKRIAVYVNPILDQKMRKGQVESVEIIDCDIVDSNGEHFTKMAVEVKKDCDNNAEKMPP